MAASIDLTDAYYSVPVATIDQKFLMFQYEGIRYMFAYQTAYHSLQEFLLNS